jgi:hypothetical protein
VKTFRRRVRSASRRVGGSNCDLKSNLSSLSSFLFFYSSVCHCLCERFHAFKIGGDIFKRKKNSFLFVVSLPSLFAFIIRLEITYAKFCLNINQLSRKFFSLQFKILSTWNCRRLLFRLFFLHQNMLSHEHSCFAGKNAVVGKLK